MFTKLLLSVLLLVAATAAPAQQSAPASTKSTTNTLTPQQQALQAELNKVGPQLVSLATKIAELIDQNKPGEVWESTSNITKAIVSKDAFVSQITADRAQLGAVKSRKLGGLSSLISDGSGTPSKESPITPAGTYINVAFATQFGTNPKPVRELVSFHLDTDQRWRVTGYTVR
jgi:hypothetical protein